jgi:uncharacterized protein
VKILLFTLGWISFVLGVIGAFLPILPTTPFLILSAYLFSKSSPKFHAWILKLPMAGEAIREWREERVIRPRAKVLCSIMLLLSIGIIWKFANVHLSIKVIASLIMVSVGMFVVTRPSAPGGVSQTL